MRNFIKKIILLIIILFQSIFSDAQSTENRIDSIIKLKDYIEQNINKSNIFDKWEFDGIIQANIKTKKVLGIFNKTVSRSYGGTFARTEIKKDTLLISVRTWTRNYLNSQKDSSIMSYEELIYDNKNLCYYYEIKKYESKNNTDSTIYEVEFFFNIEGIIKKNIQGNLGQDENNWLQQHLPASRGSVLR